MSPREAMSKVSFPHYSYIAGNPARRSGTVEIQGERVRIRVDQKKAEFREQPSGQCVTLTTRVGSTSLASTQKAFHEPR